MCRYFEYDWSRSVYEDAQENIPKDAPEPLGKDVVLTHFVDANLMHCMVRKVRIVWFLNPNSDYYILHFG